VLGRQARRMLLARALQVFLPGEPQFYYVGLLGGEDDAALFAKTGQGRDVNRHRYSREEVRRALDTEVTRGQLALAELRRHPVFTGAFAWDAPDDASLVLTWSTAGHEATLRARLDDPDFEIVLDGRAVAIG
jgi:sucrose phosphorylase